MKSLRNAAIILASAFLALLGPLDVAASGSWAPTGSMATPRALAYATVLFNGKVLVAGGFNNSTPLASSELYNPMTGTWASTGSMQAARIPNGDVAHSNTAQLLLNGQVLVVGGSQGQCGSALSSAELYNPSTGAWTQTGSMSTGRWINTVTPLFNGKVLVAGGSGGICFADILSSAELYDPATGTFTSTGSMAIGRWGHSATLLPNGKVLVAGGYNDAGAPTILSTAELYDPATGTWSPTGSMNFARRNHVASLLPNGKVLVAGGDNFGQELSSAELYDPSTGSWSLTGSMAEARNGAVGNLIFNGQFLVSGGQSSSGAQLATAELYDFITGTWSSAGMMANSHGGYAVSSILFSGKVLVAAGIGNSGFLSAADVFTP